MSAEVVAVLGMGTMGRGIAYAAAAAGLDVRVWDVDADQTERAVAWIERRRERDRAEAGSASSAADLEPACAGSVSSTSDLEPACAGAAVVIEAIVEALDAKAQLLAAAEEAAGGALLATNTSGLSVTALGARLRDASRLVGMHFFNPVHRMHLCEIVVGERSSEATTAAAIALAERMGKTPIRVVDSPGFVASRLNCALGNEALALLQEGVAPAEDIDAAARLGLNHPMGPLELLDLVGLDVRLAALETLQAAYGDRFRPTPLHRRLVAAGRLGVKAGEGVYRYDEQGRRRDAGAAIPPRDRGAERPGTGERGLTPSAEAPSIHSND